MAQLGPGIRIKAGGLCPGGWSHVYIGFLKSALGWEAEVSGRANSGCPQDLRTAPRAGVWGIYSAVAGQGRWAPCLLGRGCGGLWCYLLNF